MGGFLHFSFIESLERRLQFSTIQYGVAANGDPDVTGVLADSGPGLKDMGAQGVRLFTNTSYLSSDFDLTPSGKIYVRNPSLERSLSYAKKYHSAGIAVTLCIQLTTDRSMIDGSLLTDPVTGAARKLLPSELRSPKVFRTWYDTFSQAQISKSDSTSVTKVIDFWEIGNEPNHATGTYWPVDNTLPDRGVAQEIDSYIDHDLAPAYSVLSKLHEPVIGAGFASGTLEQYNQLNNQPGARKHQYSNNCDYLNFHPYGLLDSTNPNYTPEAYTSAFTTAMYGDGTVKKPFVMTEYNLTDLAHVYPLDPNPNPRDAAEAMEVANRLDTARAAFLKMPHVQERCAWIYYYRLIAGDTKQRGAIYYPPPDGKSAYVPLTPLYDMFKHWATGSSIAPTPKTAKGALNLGKKLPINAIAVQKNGMTLVVTDDGVRRYDTKGKLDPTYGVNGFVRLLMVGSCAALQGDGNLIVAGSQADDTPKTGAYHLVVARLSTSGKVDKGFATRGYFSLGNGSGTRAQGIALRAGKIVVAGGGGVTNGFLVRLDLNGALDPTFAGGGLTTVKHIGIFRDLAVAKSGAITTLSRPYKLVPASLLLRFTTDGALDTTFSDDGISDPQPLVGDGMFANTDGSVLLVGHDPLAKMQILARYTARGVLDTSFGVKGIQTLGAKNYIRTTPIEAADGSRYLYGSVAATLTSDTKHIFVSRLLPSGQFDPNFGTKGALTLTSTNIQDLPFAAAVNPTGLLTIAAGAFTQVDNGGMTEELFAF